MIIGFDGSRAFNPLKTGTENYSYQLLLSLAKIDKKNQYIVYIRPGINRVKVWSNNFQFITIKMPRLWTQVGLAARTFTDRLDLLFVPAHTLPVIYRPKLKTVVTVHDLGAEYLPKMHQLKQRLYLSWMTNYQLKIASRIIAVSKATKDDLMKRCKIDQKKIELVYEGYDKNLFKPVKDDILVDSLKQYNLQPGSYFLFVGTVQPRKNLERLIKAFSKIAARQLVIVGNKGWLSGEIYKLPKKLGIEDKVRFLGRVPDENLPVLYSGAAALTFPSLFEGFGLPILEAQACGCPVLTSTISSMPEVAGKGAIFVDPYKTNQISYGMLNLMDIKVRQQLVKKGFENIKKFSWERCAKETLRVLEKVGRI